MSGRKMEIPSAFLLLQLSVPGPVCGFAQFEDLCAPSKYDHFLLRALPNRNRYHCLRGCVWGASGSVPS